MPAEKPLQNRKERKELARRLQSENPGLEIVHPDAAGIVVGNEAQQFVDEGMEYYEQRYRNQQVHLLQKRAAKLGLQLVAAET